MAEPRYTDHDLFNAFLAGYDEGQDDAKHDYYAVKPFLRLRLARVRSDYGIPLPRDRYREKRR
jgi:hypothetical protein